MPGQPLSVESSRLCATAWPAKKKRGRHLSDFVATHGVQSPGQKRRLRKKALVTEGLAKTMRKLGFKFAGSGR